MKASPIEFGTFKYDKLLKKWYPDGLRVEVIITIFDNAISMIVKPGPVVYVCSDVIFTKEPDPIPEEELEDMPVLFKDQKIFPKLKTYKMRGSPITFIEILPRAKRHPKMGINPCSKLGEPLVYPKYMWGKLIDPGEVKFQMWHAMRRVSKETLAQAIVFAHVMFKRYPEIEEEINTIYFMYDQDLGFLYEDLEMKRMAQLEKARCKTIFRHNVLFELYNSQLVTRRVRIPFFVDVSVGKQNVLPVSVTGSTFVRAKVRKSVEKCSQCDLVLFSKSGIWNKKKLDKITEVKSFTFCAKHGLKSFCHKIESMHKAVISKSRKKKQGKKKRFIPEPPPVIPITIPKPAPSVQVDDKSDDKIDYGIAHTPYFQLKRRIFVSKRRYSIVNISGQNRLRLSDHGEGNPLCLKTDDLKSHPPIGKMRHVTEMDDMDHCKYHAVPPIA